MYHIKQSILISLKVGHREQKICFWKELFFAVISYYTQEILISNSALTFVANPLIRLRLPYILEVRTVICPCMNSFACQISVASTKIL